MEGVEGCSPMWGAAKVLDGCDGGAEWDDFVGPRDGWC